MQDFLGNGMVMFQTIDSHGTLLNGLMSCHYFPKLDNRRGSEKPDSVSASVLA